MKILYIDLLRKKRQPNPPKTKNAWKDANDLDPLYSSINYFLINPCHSPLRRILFPSA